MSINCPGLDSDKFRKNCRVPLFAERWNRWILCRTAEDNPTDATLKSELPRLFSRWFRSDTVWGALMRPFAEYQIKVGPREGTATVREGDADLMFFSRTARESIRWPTTVASRLRCDPLPLLKPGAVVWVAIEFVYRGKSSDMDWPAYKEPPFYWPFDPWCPIDADWILDSVGYPPAEAVPVEETTTEKVADTVVPAIAPFAPAAATAGLLIAGAVGFGLIVAIKVFR